MGQGILICGLNGAGKSTLARALCGKTGWRYLDNEDLYFPKDDPAYLYAHPRSFDEVEALLRDAVAEETPFVLAAVRGKYAADIRAHIRCAVLIEVPQEVRLQRVYDRSRAKFGARMEIGGDLYEEEQAFFASVRARPEDFTEAWLATVDLPVIRVDGTKSVDENAEYLLKRLQEIV